MIGKTFRLLTILVILATAFAYAPAATAGTAACEFRTTDNFKKLLLCVTLDGVREHPAALQAIANANGGTRLAGTQGYEDSVDYVVEKMTAAGYNVTLNSFPFNFFPPA